MLRAIVAQVLVSPSAEQRSILAEQAGLANFPGLRPSRRAIGGDALCLPGAPNRHGDCYNDGGDPAGGGDVRPLDEDVPRIGVVSEPPPEEGRRLIDWPTEEFKPWATKLGLECETPRDPLRRSPEEGEHDGADGEDLPPEDLGRVHVETRSGEPSVELSSPN